MLNAIGALIAGLLSFWIVFVKLGFKYIIPSYSAMIFYVKEGFPLFISSVSIQIYTNINKLLVGGFLGMEDVSIYDFCEKIVSLVRMPVSIIYQTIFPKVSRERELVFVNKMMIIVFFINIILCSIIILLTPTIMNFVLGNVLRSGIIVILIMLISTIIAGINIFLGGCRLVAWGYSNTYSKIVIFNSFFFVGLIFCIYILDFISLYTIVILNLLTELFALYLYYTQNRKIGLIMSSK